MAASSNTLYKVAIICGSTRSLRAGPQITAFVHSAIEQHLAATRGTTTSTPPPLALELELVDIAAFHLPLFDEAVIPRAVTDPSGYAHEHTRVWATKIAACHAFVLVTPQYNWGIPAGLKNAIDYLFNEWTGKPAMVVAYGGHGGGKAAEALQTVCRGLRMKVVERPVCLAFPDGDFAAKCLVGGDLALGEGGRNVWEREKQELVGVWEEMVELLG